MCIVNRVFHSAHTPPMQKPNKTQLQLAVRAGQKVIAKKPTAKNRERRVARHFWPRFWAKILLAVVGMLGLACNYAPATWRCLSYESWLSFECLAFSGTLYSHFIETKVALSSLTIKHLNVFHLCKVKLEILLKWLYRFKSHSFRDS